MERPAILSWFTASACIVLLLCSPVPFVILLVNTRSSRGISCLKRRFLYLSWISLASEIAIFISDTSLQDANRLRISYWHWLKNSGVSCLRVSIPRSFSSWFWFEPKYLFGTGTILFSFDETNTIQLYTSRDRSNPVSLAIWF